MSIISRLAVVLGLDTAEFNAGLGKAEQGVNKFTAIAGVMRTGVVAAGAALTAASYKAIEFADGINDIAKANEMAVSSVLEFTQALTVSGGKSDSVTKLLSSLTNKIDEAAQGSQKTRDKFKELGVTIQDLGTLSEEQILRKTVAGLAAIEDPIRRNALAFDIMGKAIKGVDIKGLNDELIRTQGSAKASDEAFAKIGDALDKLDKLSFKIKTDLANNIAGPFEQAIDAVDRFYDRVKERREREAQEASAKRSKMIEGGAPEWWKGIFGFAFEKELKDAEKKLNVFGLQMQEQKIPSILGNGLTGTPEPAGPKREIKVSDEAQKLLDKIDKQKDAMNQQAMALGRQKEALYGQKSVLEEINAEFEKGGKYYEARNTAQAQALRNSAKELDIEKEKVEKQKEAARVAIQRAQHDMEFNRRIDSIQIATDRLKLEGEIAGMSDTQRQKMMQIFDMEAEIVRMKQQDYLITQEQIEAYRAAQMALIEQQEATTRAQNTFQAGWDRAYANFKERAMDSAALGAQAFESMASNMERAIGDFVRTGKLSFKDLIGSMIQDLLRLYMQAQATNFFKMIGGSFGGGGGGGIGSWLGETFGMSGIGGYLSGLFFADGGTPPVGQASIVGERGPELFVPRTSGTIIPNNQLSNMFTPQPQVVYNGPYIANMNAMDTQSAAQFLAKNKDAVWAANQSAARGLPMGRA